MLIAKIENGCVISIVDHKEVFGNVFPSAEQLSQKSYMPVNLWRDHNPLTQCLEPYSPAIEGEWVYTMRVRDMTDEEIQAAKDSAMSQIRADRNIFLTQSDHTQIPDNPNPKKAEWATYRQTLRDLPANISGDPRTFKDWPKNPDWKPIEMGV